MMIWAKKSPHFQEKYLVLSYLKSVWSVRLVFIPKKKKKAFSESHPERFSLSTYFLHCTTFAKFSCWWNVKHFFSTKSHAREHTQAHTHSHTLCWLQLTTIACVACPSSGTFFPLWHTHTHTHKHTHTHNYYADEKLFLFCGILHFQGSYSQTDRICEFRLVWKFGNVLRINSIISSAYGYCFSFTVTWQIFVRD